MSTENLQQRALTLMFTDIVGYSRLMGRNQALTISMLEDYRRILLEQIDKQQGTVIEFIGDAVFARFDTAQSAVDAAIAIQKALFTFNHFRDKTLPRLQTRIGLHTGEVATKGESVFGDDVNIAARLEPIAVADGICVSKAVYDQVKPTLKEPVLGLGVQPLKNIEQKIKAYLIRPLGITFKTRFHYFSRRLNQQLGAYRYPIIASLFLVIISLFYWVPRWLVPGYDANYIEIANFQNLMNEGGEVDYLSSGITEALRSQLADMREVYVIKASDKGALAPIRLEGSVQKLGNNVRIAYQLIRNRNKVQIAGGKLDGRFDEIFVMQDRLVGEIAGLLSKEFSIQNFRPSIPQYTNNITAYDYYLQGKALLRETTEHGNADRAISLFSTALIHDPLFALAYAGKCKAYSRKYMISNSRDWLEKAEASCNEALQKNPETWEAFESLGAIYGNRGDFEKAIEYLEAAQRLSPQNAEVLEGVASNYERMGKNKKAREIFDSAVQLFPDNWEIRQEYASFLFQQGDYDAALPMYKSVLKVTPENIIALNGMAGIYVYTGRFDKAATVFRKSAKLDPTAFNFSNTGTLYYLVGQYELAIEMYENAIQLEPRDFRLYLHLAEAQRQQEPHSEEAFKNYLKSSYLAGQVLEENSIDLNAIQYLAGSAYFTGKREEAYGYLERAKSIDAFNLDTRFLELRFSCIDERYEEAVTLATALLRDGYSGSLLVADPDTRVLEKYIDL